MSVKWTYDNAGNEIRCQPTSLGKLIDFLFLMLGNVIFNNFLPRALIGIICNVDKHILVYIGLWAATFKQLRV